MEFKSGCLICGKDLEYTNKSEKNKCFVCGTVFESNAHCTDGHFVCDKCHSLSSNDYIEEFCVKTGKTDPLEMALTIMKNDKIKMHGPEHHFLVPAILLSSYYNKIGEPSVKIEKIKTAKKRAEIVPGGFCGFYGNC
jgi:hypothetical protein